MAKICKSCGAMNGNQAMVCSRCHRPLQGDRTMQRGGSTSYVAPTGQGGNGGQEGSWPQPPRKPNNALKAGIAIGIVIAVVAVITVAIKIGSKKTTPMIGDAQQEQEEDYLTYGSKEEAKTLADQFLTEKGFQGQQWSDTNIEENAYIVTYTIQEEHQMVSLSGNISVGVTYYLSDENKVQNGITLYHLDQTKLTWKTDELSGNWSADPDREYFDVSCVCTEGQVDIEYTGYRRDNDEEWSGSLSLPANLLEATNIQDDLEFGSVNCVNFYIDKTGLIDADFSDWTKFHVFADGVGIERENNIQNLQNSSPIMLEKQ